MPFTHSSLFLACFSVVCLWAGTPTAPTKTTATTALSTTPAKACKTLLVIGDDRSGSASAIRPLTQEDYTELSQLIQLRGGGTLATVLIGNPNPADRQDFRVTFDTPKLHKVQTIQNPTLSQDEALQIENKKIDNENRQTQQRNQTKLKDFIHIIDEKVIHYKPVHKDLTDVNDGLEHVNTLINEPTYQRYTQIVVVLFCDGINQPRNSKIEPITSQLALPAHATLYLCGWKAKKELAKLPKHFNFDSKEGVLESLKTTLCQ